MLVPSSFEASWAKLQCADLFSTPVMSFRLPTFDLRYKRLKGQNTNVHLHNVSFYSCMIAYVKIVIAIYTCFGLVIAVVTKVRIAFFMRDVRSEVISYYVQQTRVVIWVQMQ